MNMKQARTRYRRLYSERRMEAMPYSERAQKVRRWVDDRPSFREWARKNLKREPVESRKLAGIVG